MAGQVPVVENKKTINLSLYVVTDEQLAASKARTLQQVVSLAVAGGATIVQVRNKEASTRDFIAAAQKILQITRQAGIPLIINDHVDVALAIDADGCHVGDSDMPVPMVRKLLGPNKIIGVTVNSVEGAIEAQKEGADYLGTDAIFPTDTKIEKPPIGIELFQKITQATSLPVVAIGGINLDNTPAVMRAGAAGVAVVSAIMAADDVSSAARALLKKVQTYSLSPGNRTTHTHTSATPPHTPHTTHTTHNNAGQALAVQVSDILARVRELKPLVHNITNLVVMNFTANALLAVGASPIMAVAVEEVQEVVAKSSALVLNTGTLDKVMLEASHKAAGKANALHIPIILDPVGVGFTKYREESNKLLLQRNKITVLKGNHGEIGALAGDASASLKGVDSVDSPASSSASAAKMVYSYAQSLVYTIVAMTGKRDIISDGKRIIAVENGHHMMGSVTGMGCITTAVVAAFCGVEPDYLVATAGAIAIVGIAGERAARYTQGTGSFQVAFLDELYRITPHDFANECKLFEIDPTTLA